MKAARVTRAHWSRLAIAAGLSAALVGCGGSSSSDPADDEFDPIGGPVDAPSDLEDTAEACVRPQLDENGDPLLDENGDPLLFDAGGIDETSADAQWNNNCTIRRFGAFDDSYYVEGIQRILYCTGFNGDVATIEAFADQEFGPTTQAQMEAYQAARGLTADGIIGPSTWGALRDELTFIELTADGFASYRVTDEEFCGQLVQFYQVVNADNTGGGWRLAETPGSVETEEFSTTNPFTGN